MIKITANRMDNNVQATQIETSLSGSLPEILTEHAAGVVAVINEITKRFPIYFKVELLIFFPPIFI